MASMWPPKKNTAFTLYFTLFKNDGTIIANPGTITKKVSIDGAAVADIAAAVTEEDTTYGQCSVVLAAGEMNGDAIWVYIKDDTAGCVPFTCTLYTVANTLDELGSVLSTIQADTDLLDDVSGGLADIHTDVAAVKSDTAAILADTGTDGVVVAAGSKTGYSLTTAPPTAAQIKTEVEQAGSHLALIKAKTDNLPASPAAVGSAMTLTAAYDPAKTAAQAAVCTEGRLAELDAANLPADVAAVKSDTAAILTDTGTTLDTLIKDVPTVAEFEARTKPSADYFDATTDPVTVGTNNDKTGYSIGAGGIPVGGFAPGALNDAALASDAEASIATAIKQAVVEAQGSISLQQAISIILSAVAGVTTTGGAVFKDPSGAATRITATINESNERTAITLSPSA